jgi:hypothetical protein
MMSGMAADELGLGFHGAGSRDVLCAREEERFEIEMGEEGEGGGRWGD